MRKLCINYYSFIIAIIKKIFSSRYAYNTKSTEYFGKVLILVNGYNNFDLGY